MADIADNQSKSLADGAAKRLQNTRNWLEFNLATMGTNGEKLRLSELLLPIGLVGVLAILLIPMPTWLLDLFLALSMTISVVVLVTVVFVKSAVELTSFPTILLITTLLRLGLNIASTRLILTQGHTGSDAAGHVIQAFGGYVASGNYVIGGIVFTILVIINFIVITKGAGRIAEVAARFTLDSMPGKQMAIDADLANGAINDEVARARRKDLEREGSFYGAMDGASKFVRGDAIAGIIITLINVVAGIIIGVAQKNMAVAEAARNYSLLTIGDGLVSQIPGLIVSVAAGLIVTKSGIQEATDKALAKQLSANPLSLLIAGALLFLLAVIPGMPAWPFLVMFALAFGMGIFILLRNKKAALSSVGLGPDGKPRDGMENQKAGGVGGDIAGQAPPGAKSDESAVSSLSLDSIRIELGYGLLPMLNGTSSLGSMSDQVKGVRTQLANNFGFVMPQVRIIDNLQLTADSYVIYIKEIEAGRGEIRTNRLLAISNDSTMPALKGEKTTEPAFGMPAVWINESMREDAMFKGYTTIDAITVLTTHLTEIIKSYMPDLLSYGYIQDLLAVLPEQLKPMVTEIIPKQLSVATLQKILQNLLRERISIRDLGLIVETAADALNHTKSIIMLTEYVRSALARQISHSLANGQGVIEIITLSSAWEQVLLEAIQGDAASGNGQLNLSPLHMQAFIQAIDEESKKQAAAGKLPNLVVNSLLRPYLAPYLERMTGNRLELYSLNEIHSKYKIKNLGQIQMRSR